MNHNKANPIVSRLIELGFTQWQIAAVFHPDNPKKSWNNVHAWACGWYQPNAEHLKKLSEILSKVEIEQEKIAQ